MGFLLLHAEATRFKEEQEEEVSYRDAPPIIHNKKLNIFMKMNKKDAYIYEKR